MGPRGIATIGVHRGSPSPPRFADLLTLIEQIQNRATSNSKFGWPPPTACRQRGRWWMRCAYPPYETGSVVGWIRRAARCRGPGTAVARAASTRGRVVPPKFGIAAGPRPWRFGNPCCVTMSYWISGGRRFAPHGLKDERRRSAKPGLIGVDRRNCYGSRRLITTDRAR